MVQIILFHDGNIQVLQDNITQHMPSRAVLGTSASSEAAKPASTQAVISFCQYERVRSLKGREPASWHRTINTGLQELLHNEGHSLNCSPASRCSKYNGTGQRAADTNSPVTALS